jgi:hypothetical protein
MLQPVPEEHPVAAGENYDPCRPILPAGYHAQQAWGFRGSDQEFFYEFSRVYGRAVAGDGRGSVARLDQNLCYWSVIWPITGPTGDQHPAGRWVTYGQVRERRPHLSFDSFSSSAKMRFELPGLFQGR